MISPPQSDLSNLHVQTQTWSTGFPHFGFPKESRKGADGQTTTVDTAEGGSTPPTIPLVDLPDDIWLHLADVDATLEIHCTLSAINHRLRGLTKRVTRLCWPAGVPRVDRPHGSELRAANFPWLGAVLPPLTEIIGRCAGSLQFLSLRVPTEHFYVGGSPPPGGCGRCTLPSLPNLRTLFLMDDVSDLEPILRQCPHLVILGIPHFLPTLPADFTGVLEALCPQLRVIYCLLKGLRAFKVSESPASLVQISEIESAAVDETVKVTLGGGDPAGVWAGHGAAQPIFDPARVRRLALQCHPADLPGLVARLPNLEQLELVPSTAPGNMAALARTLVQGCPRLSELHLGPNVALANPEDLAEVGPVLVSLTGRLMAIAAAGSGSLVALPTPWLRRCDLQLRTDASMITFELPRVQELSLGVSPSLARLTLCCPWLRSISITVRTRAGGGGAFGQPLCVECQGPLPLSSVELHSTLGLSAHPPSAPPHLFFCPTRAPDMRIYESCCAPLVAAATGVVDVRLELPQVTINAAKDRTGLESLPASVHHLALGLKGAEDLLLPPTVSCLVLSQANCRSTRVIGPGLRTLELSGSASRSPRLLELNTPLLGELVMSDGIPAITFVSSAPVRRLVAHRSPNNREDAEALAGLLRGPAGPTLTELSFHSPPGVITPPPVIELPALRSLRITTSTALGFQGPTPPVHAVVLCPALERLACEGHLALQSDCPFLARLGLQLPSTPPLPLPKPVARMGEEGPGTRARGATVVLLACCGPPSDDAWENSPESSDTGAAIRTVILENATPSTLLAHLIAHRPDVLLLECPTTRDALILRTPNAPRLRPFLALDLLAIFTSAGFAPLAILHRWPRETSGSTQPDLFMRSLWRGLRDVWRLVGHFQKAPELNRYLSALSRGNPARPDVALEALTQARMTAEEARSLGYIGHRPAAPITDHSKPELIAPVIMRSARNLQMYFRGVRLCDLADAVRERSHEFRCECSPPRKSQFRLAWACRECNYGSAVMIHDEAVVLPDSATRLSCLPVLRSSATRTFDDDLSQLTEFGMPSDRCGVPAFCTRCLLKGRRMPNVLPIAVCDRCRTTELILCEDIDRPPALEPFDEGPPSGPQQQPVPLHCPPPADPASMPQPPLRVLVVTSDPKSDQWNLARWCSSQGMLEPVRGREEERWVDPLEEAREKVARAQSVVTQARDPSTVERARRYAESLAFGYQRDLEQRQARIATWGNIVVPTVSLRDASLVPLQEFRSPHTIPIPKCGCGATGALAASQPDVLVFMAGPRDRLFPGRPDFLSPQPPADLLHCIDQACPRLPRLVVLLGLGHAVDTGRFLQRNLRPDAPEGTGLERVVASTDQMTDAVGTRFLAALLAYLPHNPPEDLDEVLEIACRQAHQLQQQQQQPTSVRHLRVLIRVAPCGDGPADSVD
ncbi:hypothetical protein PAPYR_9566 [Paratrimastix pyriformis]|uniref:Uncharacterized protein n=1 Tax=Paratrimastix pyriformis TaxID=342808 RepID=A0ABQ8U832_9EUKA|nr:hypothetical protein PAPYR_9566 [Paratrimastix pyriformis]